MRYHTPQDVSTMLKLASSFSLSEQEAAVIKASAYLSGTEKGPAVGQKGMSSHSAASVGRAAAD